MTDILRNHMRIEAEKVLGTVARTRHGVVRNYDPTHYTVRVEIQPEGVLTGYIPIESPYVGDNFGMVVGPEIGDVVKLSFQEGSLKASTCGGKFFNAQNQPPPCPSGEFWIVHKTGSMVKFHNDGSVELSASTNLTVTAGEVLRFIAPTIQIHTTVEYRWDVNGHGQAWLPTKIDTYQIGEVPGASHPISPPEIGD